MNLAILTQQNEKNLSSCSKKTADDYQLKLKKEQILQKISQNC